MPTKVSIVKAMVFPVVIYTTWALEHKEGYCCLVTQLCLTLCDPHGLQQASLPCPSLSPRVCSNLCPLSQWCHPTISSSVAPFSCPQSFPASGFFDGGAETLVLEKTTESPLDRKEIKSVNCKGNQSWIFIGRTDAEAPTLWPPVGKSGLTGKDPMPWKTEGKRRRGQQRVRWFDSITNSMDMNLSKLRGDSGGQSLACSPCSHRVGHSY